MRPFVPTLALVGVAVTASIASADEPPRHVSNAPAPHHDKATRTASAARPRKDAHKKDAHRRHAASASADATDAIDATIDEPVARPAAKPIVRPAVLVSAPVADADDDTASTPCRAPSIPIRS